MNCIILGDKSDIAKRLELYLIADKWIVRGWHRYQAVPMLRWDLAIIAIGAVAPVGMWYEQDALSWQSCIESNLSIPAALLMEIWKARKLNASVCFMAGSNPNKVMAGYSAYNASKMGLLKLCEQLDFETADAKFFALGPGYVKTKIHNATLEANWPNERIARGDEGTPIYKIYDCLKWCIAQPKEIVGGRNICASDPYGPELAEKLKANPSMYKLRRIE